MAGSEVSPTRSGDGATWVTDTEGRARVRRAYVIGVHRAEGAVDRVAVIDADSGWAGELSHVELIP